MTARAALANLASSSLQDAGSVERLRAPDLGLELGFSTQTPPYSSFEQIVAENRDNGGVSALTWIADLLTELRTGCVAREQIDIVVIGGSARAAR